MAIVFLQHADVTEVVTAAADWLWEGFSDSASNEQNILSLKVKTDTVLSVGVISYGGWQGQMTQIISVSDSETHENPKQTAATETCCNEKLLPFFCFILSKIRVSYHL